MFWKVRSITPIDEKIRPSELLAFLQLSKSDFSPVEVDMIFSLDNTYMMEYYKDK